jgi:putative Mn2+ efflux pump MntP
MQEMNFWYGLLSGVLFIVFGLAVILKADKWVRLTVESWSFWGFHRKFSDLELKVMKISWIIGGSILIIVGIWIIINRK